MRVISNQLKLICLGIISVLVACAFFYILESDVDWSSNDQSAYVIDGFYYYKLATIYHIDKLSEILANPLNKSTSGVLLINMLYASFLPIELYPFVNVLLLVGVVSSLYKIRSSFLFALALILVIPYTIVVTKEFVVLIGALLLFSKGALFIRLFGFFLVVMGRPESAAILVLTYFLFWLLKNRGKFFLSFAFAGLASLYLIYFRNALFDAGLVVQELAVFSWSSCQVPLFATCLTSISEFEWTILQRNLSVILFPAKWLIDVFSIQSMFSLYYFCTALFLILFLVCSNYVKLLVLRRPEIFAFCALNISAYLSLYFVAASRPVAYYSSLILIFAILKPIQTNEGVFYGRQQ